MAKYETLIKRMLEDNDSFINYRKEVEQHLSFVEDYLIKLKVNKIDVLISISLNTVAYSVTLLIAFWSIPSLNANNIYPLLIVIVSIIMLVVLVIFREKTVNKLSSGFLKDKLKFIKLLRKDEGIRRELANLKKKVRV